jgi:hypothetical protein
MRRCSRYDVGVPCVFEKLDGVLARRGTSTVDKNGLSASGGGDVTGNLGGGNFK